jgi:hypothetical protein
MAGEVSPGLNCLPSTVNQSVQVVGIELASCQPISIHLLVALLMKSARVIPSYCHRHHECPRFLAGRKDTARAPVKYRPDASAKRAPWMLPCWYLVACADAKEDGLESCYWLAATRTVPRQ